MLRMKACEAEIVANANVLLGEVKRTEETMKHLKDDRLLDDRL